MGILTCNRQVFGSGNQGVIDIIGDEIRNRTLVIVEGAHPTCVQSIDGIPTVKGGIVGNIRAPTKIEVELAIAVTNTAANESMSGLTLGTRIIERETLFETGNKHFFPVIFGERITIVQSGMFSITEIIGNSSRNILGICSRTI